MKTGSSLDTLKALCDTATQEQLLTTLLLLPVECKEARRFVWYQIYKRDKKQADILMNEIIAAEQERGI